MKQIKLSRRGALICVFFLIPSCADNTGHGVSHRPPGIDGNVSGDFVIDYEVSAPETKTSMLKRLENPVLYYSVCGSSYTARKPTKLDLQQADNAVIITFKVNRNDIRTQQAETPISFKYYFQYIFDQEYRSLADQTKPNVLLWQ